MTDSYRPRGGGRHSRGGGGIGRGGYGSSARGDRGGHPVGRPPSYELDGSHRQPEGGQRQSGGRGANTEVPGEQFDAGDRVSHRGSGGGNNAGRGDGRGRGRGGGTGYNAQADPSRTTSGPNFSDRGRQFVGGSGSNTGRGGGDGGVRSGGGGNGNGNGAGGGHGSGERAEVGATVQEKLRWLQSKKANWDAGKLVHELCGPNKSNWVAVVHGTAEDLKGDLLREVLELLSHPDLKDLPQQTQLHMPLLDPAAAVGMKNFLSREGPLSKIEVEDAAQEYGSDTWQRKECDGRLLVAALEVLMISHADAQTAHSDVIELLDMRFATLLGRSDGEADDGTRAPTGKWAFAVATKAEKISLCERASHLRSRLAHLVRLQDSAQRAQREAAKREEAGRAAELERRRDVLQRAKNGPLYLDDPEHDTDYVDLPIVPRPSELLDSARRALPSNLVTKPRRSGLMHRAMYQGDEASDDDDEQAATSAAVGDGDGLASVRYRNADHLLNTHFQLVRHECTSQLRDVLAAFQQHLRSALDGGLEMSRAVDETVRNMLRARGQSRVNIYRDVGVRRLRGTPSGTLGYVMGFTVPGGRPVDWKQSSRLMDGSLLCLSPDGSFEPDSFVLATVAESVRAPDKLPPAWTPEVTIAVDMESTARFDPTRSYVMLESPVYFESFRHALAALKALHGRPLPFEAELLGHSKSSPPPAYLFRGPADPHQRPLGWKRTPGDTAPPIRLGADGASIRGWNMAEVFPHFEAATGSAFWDPRTTPELPDFNGGLDASQRKAVAAALSHGLSLIQGPPGCGKTFVGVVITRLLLANRDLRARKPILFICQTNHALDQILSLVLKYDQAMVRVGGRCKDEALLPYMLNKLREKSSNAPEYYKARDAQTVALAGLFATVTQRRTANAMQGPSGVFDNATLARLRVLLETVYRLHGYGKGAVVPVPGGGAKPVVNPVDALLNELPGPQAKTLWAASAAVAHRELCSSRDNDSLPWPAWVPSTADGVDSNDAENAAYQEWRRMSVSIRAVKLASYQPPPTTTASLSVPSVVNLWIASTPRKQQRRRQQPASDGWQVVGNSDINNEDIEEDGAKAPHPSASPDSGKATTNEPTPLATTPIAVEDAEDADAERERELREVDDGWDYDKADAWNSEGLARSRFLREEQAVQLVVERPLGLGGDPTMAPATRESAELGLLEDRAGFSPQERVALRNTQALSNLWSLPTATRAQLASLWARLLAADAELVAQRVTAEYAAAGKVISSLKARVDSAHIRGAHIVGMTTTGASKFGELLRELAPEVVMVEEAAEVLEAHILAALTPAVKQLILIGDHLQLRPQVSVYDLARNYALDVSLFERLVAAGVGHVTLTTQRRMHPDIASLIRPAVYRTLRDADSVQRHPPVRGVKERLFFVTHTVPEDGATRAFGAPEGAANPGGGLAVRGRDATDGIKTNEHEAKLIVRFLRHLLLNGYDAKSLVVLSLYKGQLALLKRLAGQERPVPGMDIVTAASVRQTTVDNYQGEENDVVIVSLVRSNTSGRDGCGNIGFTSVANRINVAVSRARHGLYVFGNFALMRYKSDLWEKMAAVAEARGQLGPALPLQCPNHTEAPVIWAASPEDFDTSSPHGGCLLVCGAPMDCGHTCKKVCHVVEHSKLQCTQPCVKPRPLGCTHPCRGLCYQPCKSCQVLVGKTRASCGHRIRQACGIDAELVPCPAECNALLPCGHNCQLNCHSPSIREHDKCQRPCSRTRLTCAHACRKKCWESCGDCMQVVAHALPCGHTVQGPCSAAAASLVCSKRCSKIFPCGHPCTKPCAEACDLLCARQASKPLPLCRAPVKHIVKVSCGADLSAEVCTLWCKAELPCGHACTNVCDDCYPAPNIGDNIAASMTPHHAPCSSPCSALLPCGHRCRGSHSCGSGPCPACQEPCQVKCAHRTCPRSCGELCEPCSQPCGWSCPHGGCKALCSEPHRLEPPAACNLPCMLKLACGHECMGLCGEVCPPLCIVCTPERVSARRVATAMLLGWPRPQAVTTAATADLARFVAFHCGHAYEAAAMDRYAAFLRCGRPEEALTTAAPAPSAALRASPEPLFRLPACPEPRCGAPLRGVYRYDDILHAAAAAMEPAKLIALTALYRGEVGRDLAAGAAGAVVERLRAKLGNNGGVGRDPVRPLLQRLLGEALMQMGDLQGALTELQLASSGSDCGEQLRLEAAILSTQCVLGGVKAQGLANALACAKLEPLSQLRRALGLLEPLEGEMSSFPAMGNDLLRDATALLRMLRGLVDERVARADFEARAKAERDARIAKATEDERARLARETAVREVKNTRKPLDTPTTAEQTRLATEMETNVRERGGGTLHMAAARGALAEVEMLLRTGADPTQRDKVGDTALHVAARGRNAEIVRALLPMSPWCAINNAGWSPIDDALYRPGKVQTQPQPPAQPPLPSGRLQSQAAAAIPAAGSGVGRGKVQPAAGTAGAAAVKTPIRPPPTPRGTPYEDATADLVRAQLKEALSGSSPDAVREWAAMRSLENENCDALDELMGLTGLREVKTEALKLYRIVKTDLKRDPESRMATTQAMNFVFTGNPGTGKTTVARIFARMLEQLGLRESSEVCEATGQALLDEGSSKFKDRLDGLDEGGVVFIDEVYQLDPINNSQGRAITNIVMAAAEDKRDKLTFIVAGYKDDVQDKWLASNDGLPSRFPFAIDFSDFKEAELRSIFLNLVQQRRWRLEPPRNPSGAGGAPPVDLATIAARRLARGAGRKGFGNARSVRVLVETAQRRANERIMRESSPTGDALSTLTRDDVLGPALQLEACVALAELNKLPGLPSVKKAVRGLLRLALDNRLREEEGKQVQDVSLHRLFLGNPGTGKTTVAKIYAALLRELGYLSKGGVTVVGASKLTGDVVGGTAAKVNSALDGAKGGVLVIDEAYVLAGTMYGKEALDTIVERVQGTPGEDFAVLMCGYTKEMEEMLRTCNPGLKRRFRAEDSFTFDDYDDDALEAIMTHMAQERGLKLADGLAKAAVVNVLAKQRAKPNFGNAGAVRNLLEVGISRMSRRRDDALTAAEKESSNGNSRIGSGIAGTAPDELIAADLFEEPAPGAARAALANMVNAQPFLDHIDALEKRIRVQKTRGGVKPESLLRNYCFVGPPGTGKTTVARAFGEVFHGLGLLADSKVVEVKGQELIAGYTGQTAPLVKTKLDEARGGVLFIDEAYALAYGTQAQMLLGGPAGSSFAKDALEALLANLTDPTYQGKMLVIIAGYERHIEAVLASNPGMARRFTERLIFEPWSPASCLELVHDRCKRQRLHLPHELDNQLLEGFTRLIEREGWGNAGDAVTVAAKIQEAWEARCADSESDTTDLPVSDGDVRHALQALLSQRRLATAAVGTASLSGGSEQQEEATGNGAVAPTQRENRSAAQQQQNRVAQQAQPAGGRGDDSGNAERKAQRQTESESTRRAEQVAPPEDGPLLASLQAALRTLGYDLQRALEIVTARVLPADLLRLVASETGRSVEAVRTALVAQCPTLQPRLQAALDQQQAEAERQKRAQAEIERANEEERARLVEEEEERKRRMMGAFICGVCGRMGCPVMPIWRTWAEGAPAPQAGVYNGNNGPAYGGGAPRVL